MRDSEFRKLLEPYVRKIKCAIDFETASGKVIANDGIRARVAPWGVDTDYVLMASSPNLLSLGGQCVRQNFSFIWINGKHPCFISPGGRCIIILDIVDVLPVWSPYHEQGSQFLGTYEFKMNLFRV